MVKKFYLDDKNGRMMPGMKDFVSVKRYDGSRDHVQKKLILCNLPELYANFKAQHPSVKICLSKSSQLSSDVTSNENIDVFKHRYIEKITSM